jgi:hypothetical protein
MEAQSVIVEALLEVEGPKKARRLVRAIAKAQARREANTEVLDFLPIVEREARTFEHRRTGEWLRANLPSWLAMLGHW